MTPVTKQRHGSRLFRRTTAINRIRKMKKRIRVVQGGTSAGKTYGIIPVLIDRAIKTPFLEISIVAETLPHLKKGAIKDFKKIMQTTGRWSRKHWHESDKKYTFSNGSYIEFFSVDDEAKVRGPRRNVLYVNEANNIKWETFYQLLIRTDMEVYLDYNPVTEFWVHTEIIPKKNAEFLQLTYKDNEALAKTTRRELVSNLRKAYYNPRGDYDNPKNIKDAYWANWCKVYLRGEVGVLQDAVFNSWKQVDEVPPNARLLGYGLDFGYSVDPTALVAVYKYNDEFIFDEIIYQTGLTSGALAKMMEQEGVNKKMTIFCDKADPRMKDELRLYGFNVMGATKGSDSINFGIDILQGCKMRITKRSLNIIKELRSYVWRKNRAGEKTQKPIDAFNHAIDAMRYFAIMMISLKRPGSRTSVTYTN